MAPRVPSQSPTSTELHRERITERKKARESENTSTRSRTEETAAAVVRETPFTSSSTLSPHDTTLGMYGINSMAYGGSLGMYGMGGGYGYGGGMMMGSPYYGMMPPMGGPLSTLNQFLFGVQNVVFSLGQAVQIVGMNTQALRQTLESASAMFDHAIATWNEMQVIEAASRENESEEMKKRRRRLRALRWAMVVAVSYAGYRLLKRVFSSQKRRPPMQIEGQPPSYTVQPGSTYRPSSHNSYFSSGYGQPPIGGYHSSTGGYPYY